MYKMIFLRVRVSLIMPPNTNIKSNVCTKGRGKVKINTVLHVLHIGCVYAR